ncbi:Pumilio-like proteiny domain family member 6 [Exophiala dermatitidis]|nr:Pumilio y domain member 6 [Exophiala dermatitidis]KAJ4549655.1 Pumilio y domain member 6 [Exophiala dermatitidis]
MAGTKRTHDNTEAKASKKAKVASELPKQAKSASLEDDFVPFDDADNGTALAVSDGKAKKQKEKYRPQVYKAPKKPEPYLNGTTTSREAHAKQKALTQDRKSAKPNADSIARSKKIWERLRRKSHVPKEERDELVKELFEIISGRVKDFVFKHDAVRVIQCALKYATPEQRRQITRDLKGTYRELAESKYAKFLIAKMVVKDDESRDAVVEEFYGHVKRLIRHPEASWILDDIYRGIATKQQKAIMLREWYGPEFAVFAKSNGTTSGEEVTADLSEILKQNPEKRGPFMQHLKEMTNQLVQKKTTAFTMLHDALLQYFLNCKPGSPEVEEFLAMLRDDEEGDVYKNLAFTKSGSRLVCLALAYGNSKDRRGILKFFKTHIKLMASDVYAHRVLLTAYECIDDTVMTAKAIFPELLSKDLDQEAREQELLAQVDHLTARIPLLYLMFQDAPKWLLPDESAAIIKEVREIRTQTSKKDPEVRRTELMKAISQTLLDLIASQTEALAKSTFGCKYMLETLLGAIGEKEAALTAIADLATSRDESEAMTALLSSPPFGRLLKGLVQGGRFDASTKTVKQVEPPLKFHELLYERIKNQSEDDDGAGEIVKWATGPNSFVIVAMLEAEDFSHADELKAIIKKNASSLDEDNAGARIILEKVGKRPAKGDDNEVKDSKEKKSGQEKKSKKDKKSKSK